MMQGTDVEERYREAMCRRYDLELMVRFGGGAGLPHRVPNPPGWARIYQGQDGWWPRREDFVVDRFRNVLWVQHREPQPPIDDDHVLEWDMLITMTEEGK